MKKIDRAQKELLERTAKASKEKAIDKTIDKLSGKAGKLIQVARQGKEKRREVRRKSKGSF